MYGRQNLYRQQHWQLAERQRYLTELESLAERLRTDVELLNREIVQVGGPIEPGRVHGVFVRVLVARREKLERSVAEIDLQIVEARAAVAAAQQEMRLVGSPLARHSTFDETRPVRRVRRPV